jgi:hypothetical protein
LDFCCKTRLGFFANVALIHDAVHLKFALFQKFKFLNIY